LIVDTSIDTTRRRLARRVLRRLVRVQDSRVLAWRVLALARRAHAAIDAMVGPLVDAGLRDVATAVVRLGQAIEDAEVRMGEERRLQEQ
jgi:hypothetical protein